MLWFLSLAARRGLVVEEYCDEALGTMATNSDGQPAMVEVTLRPAVEFESDSRPTGDEITALHDQAHDKCFIAHSVKTKVVCDPLI